MAAAISISNSFHTKTSVIQQPHHIQKNPRFFITVCCHNHEHVDPVMNQVKKEEDKKVKNKGSLFVGVEKFGKDLKDTLSPKQKGDWKDLTLMSLSFAVYVYMSQKIVCAYCAWMSMLQHSW